MADNIIQQIKQLSPSNELLTRHHITLLSVIATGHKCKIQIFSISGEYTFQPVLFQITQNIPLGSCKMYKMNVLT